MIAFIDINNHKIYLYSESGKKDYKFSNIYSFIKDTNNKDILYVTNAVKTTANDIMNTLVANNLITQDDIDRFQKNSNKKYLHATRSSVLIPELGLEFDNKYIFLEVDLLKQKHGEDFLNNNTINTLLEKGTLEIVDGLEVKKAYQELEKKQKQKDKGIDSIIVDGSVEDYVNSYNAGEVSDDDYMEIDVSGSGFGGGDNEGALLPDDFEGDNEGALLPDDFEG